MKSSPEAWIKLAATFRKNYTFPVNAAHSWFPGHMYKSLKVMQRKLTDVDCVVEVHDARIPISGRNKRFRDSITGARPHILLLNKQDLVDEASKEDVMSAVMEMDPAVSKVLFTNCKDPMCPGVRAVLPTAQELIEEHNRYHRAGRPDSNILVIGIPNVGKSTLINMLRANHLRVGGRPAAVGPTPGVTMATSERIRVSDYPLVYLLDTPGIMMPHIKNMHVGMRLAMCATLRDNLVGEDNIADYMLWWLNRHHNFSYVDYMGLEEPVDNGKIMLARSAHAQGFYRKIPKRMIEGGGPAVIPDIDRAARTFLLGFRTGQFGPINLDSDALGIAKFSQSVTSRNGT